MSNKQLYMDFITDEGGKLKISIKGTRDDLETAEINEAMDTLIETQVFANKKGKISKKSEAYYLTRVIDKIEIAE